MHSTLEIRAREAEQFLQRLRQSTASQHRRLEESPVSLRLMQDDLSLQDYISYLLRMKSVIFYSEQIIYPQLDGLLADLAERKKLHWIEADLIALGADPASMEYQPGFFSEATTGFYLGFAYVIEGSTLGGRVLYKQVQKRLGITNSLGASFFYGYGPDTGTKWKIFLETVGDFAVAAKAETQIISGARRAFETIHEHFSKPFAS